MIQPISLYFGLNILKTQAQFCLMTSFLTILNVPNCLSQNLLEFAKTIVACCIDTLNKGATIMDNQFFSRSFLWMFIDYMGM